MEEYQDHSLGSRVFQKIRDNILNGTYKENDELRETAIGKELGVSRTPVREAMLEGLCARWAAEHITEEQLDQLEESLLLSEFQMKKESGFSTEQVAALDGRFHAVLYEASGSRMLKHVLTDFHNYVQRARKSSIVSEERARKSIREHRQILRAIKDRDAEMAEQLANEHIIHVMQNLKKQGY